MGEYGKIYAWPDGFRYPLGYFSEQHSWKDIEFKFGNWGTGLLDFSILSYTHDKTLIGLPEVYAWCNAWMVDPGAEDNNFGGRRPFGNATIEERKYFLGSRWNTTETAGLSKRFVTTTQEISVHEDSIIWNTDYDVFERLRLSFGIGWLVPKFSETAQFGI